MTRFVNDHVYMSPPPWAPAVPRVPPQMAGAAIIAGGKKMLAATMPAVRPILFHISRLAAAFCSAVCRRLPNPVVPEDAS